MLAYRDYERFDRLFCRVPNGWGSRGRLTEYNKLIRAWMDGHVSFGLVRVPREAIARAAASALYASVPGESAQHQFLKRIALEWMRLEGHRKAIVEARRFGYRLDCYSEDKADWIIECGHTSPEKFMDLAYQRNPCRLMVLPFSRALGRDAIERGSLPPLHAVQVNISDTFLVADMSQRMEAQRDALDKVFGSLRLPE